VAFFTAQGRYSVLILDNRGVGRSDAPPTYYTTKDMALDTLELLKHVGWTQDVNVVGISMGGMISQELALVAPDGLVKTLTLISTHAGTLVAPWPAIRFILRAMTTTDPNIRLHAAATVLFPRAYLDQPSTSDPAKTNRQVIVDVMLGRIDKVPVQSRAGALGQLAAVQRHKLTPEQLKRIKDRGFPILVITGLQDDMVRARHSFHLAKHLDAKLVTFEDCGHVVHAQKEAEFHKLLVGHVL
jgi:pimeloyl-ACP methyl ester carboxylesterase